MLTIWDNVNVDDTQGSPARKRALSGPLAAILFFAGLIGFAARRSDGYTHGTKAVSELGAIGAPDALAFNIVAFILPGLFIALLALSIFRLSPGNRSLTGVVALALSGVAMMIAGIFPVDMGNLSSFTSIAHASGATLSGLLWAVSLIFLGPVLKRDLRLGVIGTLTPWFSLFLVTNVGWQVVWQTSAAVLPGWGQRIGFAGYFLWAFWVGAAIYLTRNDPPHADR